MSVLTALAVLALSVAAVAAVVLAIQQQRATNRLSRNFAAQREIVLELAEIETSRASGGHVRGGRLYELDGELPEEILPRPDR